MKAGWHNWKIVDWDVKNQIEQTSVNFGSDLTVFSFDVTPSTNNMARGNFFSFLPSL